MQSRIWVKILLKVWSLIYDPDFLKTISPEKLAILERHDANNPKQEVTAQRVPKDEIKLPEVKSEVVYYYIKEPAEKPVS